MLKFAYTDIDGLMLTSDNNKQIAEEVLKHINEKVSKKQAELTESSLTFTPYFDITIKEEEKALIEEVPVSAEVKDKVKNYQLQSNFKLQ